MIKLDSIEREYLKILTEESTVKYFENWVYENQNIITSENGTEIYEELIILNYTTRESKANIAKILKINYEKLESYQIQEAIKAAIRENPKLEKVNYEFDVYDMDYVSFDFKIGPLNFRMHNPFDYKGDTIRTNEEMELAFSEKFGSEIVFLESIVNSIGTQNFRVHTWKKNIVIENIKETKTFKTKIDEFKLLIDRHYCFVKKDYIKKQMKNAWL